MKVKLTNADKQSLFVSDLGEEKSTKYLKGKTLPYDVEVTLPDDDTTYKSWKEGGLKAAIDAGDVTIVTASTAITQMLSHAITATAAQAVATLSAGYITGNRSLHVFVNGALQPKPGMTGATYAETNSTTVTFSPALSLDDDVQFIWSK